MLTEEQTNEAFEPHACAQRKLAAAMREARDLTRDIQRLAAARSGRREHPRLASLAAMARQRSILDPAFLDALGSLIAAMDRRLAGAIAERESFGTAAAAESSAGAGSDEDLPTLVALRARSAALMLTIDDVIDLVMAGDAIAELRFFPDRGRASGGREGSSGASPEADTAP